MKFRFIIFVLLCFISAVLPVAAQQDYSDVQITVTPVNGSIYMLEGAGGNIGVSAGLDGILIIDTQFAPLAEKIQAALKNLSSGPLKYVLNTHFHGDHTGGNPVFGRFAAIMGHTNLRKRLMDQPAVAQPVITFSESVTLHFNNEEIKAIHYPAGHTDTDIMIHFPDSDVLHMGDQFFAGRYPYVDLNNGGDVEGLVKNIEGLLTHLPENVKIIPGHGALSNRNDLEEYYQMLNETVGIVRRGLEEGKSIETVKSEGFPPKYKDWGAGFITGERWIETIYWSLTR